MRDPAAHSSSESPVADVIVAGAGAVGLAIAIALARGGLSVLLAGRLDTRPTGRTVALLEGSVRLLEALGVWPSLASDTAPLRAMRIVDDTGSLFRVPPVLFEAREIGRDAFGYNIANTTLLRTLGEVARNTAGLSFLDEHLRTFSFDANAVCVETESGARFFGAVLAAADGRRSPARRAAGLAAREWRYPQTALTAMLRHERAHDGVSTEFHTRAGPFTLVPLPAGPAAPHRSSLVWVMRPEDARRRASLDRMALSADIERQSRHLLGRVDIEGDPGVFPIAGLSCPQLTGTRVALAGESAHALPPIGAQGLNLGLRDAAALASVLTEAHRRKEDLGSSAVLDRYARAQRGDVALRTRAVDLLNRALIADALPADMLRGAGLLALAAIGPLRRQVMREGMAPRLANGSF